MSAKKSRGRVPRKSIPQPKYCPVCGGMILRDNPTYTGIGLLAECVRCDAHFEVFGRH